MTLAEARTLLDGCRAGDQRDGYSILQRLKATFQAASEADQVVLNKVVREWLVSSDAKDSYDGAWLTSQLTLTENLDLIRRLRDEAERRDDPAAPFDWDKYNRIAGRLAARGPRRRE
jgi:hypothetical protein